jgi:hypothetical protein
MPADRVKGEAHARPRRPLTRPVGEAAAGEGSGRAEADGNPQGMNRAPARKLPGVPYDLSNVLPQNLLQRR